ncbi:MAG: hypothetical protein OXP09_00845 [Gammaproteobacteria bacterium]|nr:hypothetical protein [Gammaproteobacteria bacterium]
MTKRSNVLIVGAGAGGMVTGYHFALSGADVTFFVRANRVSEMARKPKRLYCYDDHETKIFDQYQTVCSTDEVAAQRFDYVLTTLDGFAMHSDEGMELLRNLGNAIRPSEAVLVCLGVAHGIEDFIAHHTSIPSERCLFGSFSFLSHNIPLPDQRFHPDIDQEALSNCVFAYVHLGQSNAGLTLTRTNRKLGQELAKAFDRSGVSTFSVVPNLSVMDFLSCFPFPGLIAFVIEGWPEPEVMYKTENWELASKATLEILALPQYGYLGKLLAVLGGPLKFLTRVWRGTSKAALPLDYHAFNKFHHGGKVLAQDMEIVRDILHREEGRGRELPNLGRLLKRLDESEVQPTDHMAP